MPRRLPRFIPELELEDRRKVAKVVGEAVAPVGSPGGTAGGDEQRLRGLPAVSRHSAGAIRGTNPLAALLAKER